MKRHYKKPGKATDKSIRKSKSATKGRGRNILFTDKLPAYSPEKIKKTNHIVRQNLPIEAKMRGKEQITIKKADYLANVASKNRKLVTAELISDIIIQNKEVRKLLTPQGMAKIGIKPNQLIEKIPLEKRQRIFLNATKGKKEEQKTALAMALNLIPKKSYIPKGQ